jgi:penicillin-binding protein 2
MNMKDAIIQSCDVYFYDLAYNLGIDKMSDLLAQFGFGQKTNVDSTGERNGILPSREWKLKTRGVHWFPGETLNTAIGQGDFLVTPLQLANATAALSIKGKRLRPHLVSAIKDDNNGVLLETQPEIAGQYPFIKELNWKHIQDSMINVVHGLRGTAYRISWGMEYKAAGKTGTSQVFGIAQDDEYDEETVPKNLRDHALFISYAPVENPRIAVAVIVENGGHGSSTAAPIARRVMDAYLLGQL